MIRRRTPLKRSTKPIPKRSKSPVRAERLRLYEQAKWAALNALASKQTPNPILYERYEIHCEWPGCLTTDVDCHHTHGRTGSNLYDKTKLKFLCRRHHQQVHHDPKFARTLGLIQ